MGFCPVGLVPKKAAINALICRAWVTGAAWPAPETNSSFSIAQQGRQFIRRHRQRKPVDVSNGIGRMGYING